MAKMARCDNKECFAYADGRCRSLSNNNFGNRACSFFKNKKDQNWGSLMADCRAYGDSHGGTEV